MNSTELHELLIEAEEAEAQSNYEVAEGLSLQIVSAPSDTRTESTVVKAGAARLLGVISWRRGDYPKALEYLNIALKQCEEVSDTSGIARASGNIGTVYWSLSDYEKALEYFNKAMSTYEELDNNRGIAATLGNIGSVYLSLSDYPKALRYLNNALLLNEELGDSAGIATNSLNIGIVHWHLTDYAKALEYLSKSHSLNEALGNKVGIAIGLGNMGAVYANLEDITKSLEYNSKALALHEELDNKAGIAFSLSNIGSLCVKQQDYDRALELYMRSLNIEDELGLRSEAAETRISLGSLYTTENWSGCDLLKAEQLLLESLAITEELGTRKYEAHQLLADLYERQKRWQDFANHIKKYQKLKDEVQGEETKKSAWQMEQSRRIAEREKEIEIAKALVDARMNATSTLLYKVLPESVATRIIEGEEDIADYYPQVSILFADIVGFTPISADMPAIIVIRFLNYVFGEFDRIVKKHGCEKIKTIGDGYMAVAGAPVECADHAERLAAAALEMQDTISLPESIREYMPNDVKLGVRIGLHTGSVVAGVIGEERFVYDIYSDAVNTAARMESHGEANKIHVSNDFFRHLQNRFAMTKNTTHGFVFEKRGEMEIKGKGMMRTYFLEKV